KRNRQVRWRSPAIPDRSAAWNSGNDRFTRFESRSGVVAENGATRIDQNLSVGEIVIGRLSGCASSHRNEGHRSQQRRDNPEGRRRTTTNSIRVRGQAKRERGQQSMHNTDTPKSGN